jgi:predicted MPP superfamily phosphohydrolase
MLLTAIILWSAVGFIAFAALYGACVEARRLRVDEITVRLPRLPEKLAGLRLVHIADTHFKPSRFSRCLYESMVRAIQEAAPDLVLISGDLAAGAENLPVAVGWLARLQAKHGVFAVLGNHDLNITMERWLMGAAQTVQVEDVRRQLAEAGVRVLHNEHTLLQINQSRVLLVGVGDVSSGLDDVAAALEGAEAADLVIMLSHSPDLVERAGVEVADLVLCGHTHGGQMMLPGMGAVWAPVWRDRRRAAGLLAFGDVACHVTRGVGVTWPFRFNCPPQVAVLELQPGPVNGRPLPPALRHRLVSAGVAAAPGEGGGQ